MYNNKHIKINEISLTRSSANLTKIQRKGYLLKKGEVSFYINDKILPHVGEVHGTFFQDCLEYDYSYLLFSPVA